ncbi:MAG: diaminopimelate decarboxylase [Rhodospirillaceae bacterium]|nr:diaminopimelate decarboxylase [Rhodospirillaceae bacterium]MYH35582.1 diaminopimelate decarboxylase [Rhodospirillaceae bacterium]MYK13310.1 diaminopimelate decarboxylase [Rhodospirillaceae bacterium]MYK59396.1 diaminopimelate decarboxylase [Rhodospirillaceae bacterium]
MTDRVPSPDFTYAGGTLCAEALPLSGIAAEVGTPFYCYSLAGLTRSYRALEAALTGLPATICYALKANSNQAVIAAFAGLGAGADVVSGGELRRALAAGVPAGRIVFSGVGKTQEEIALALRSGIHQLNVESEAELDLISAVAAGAGVTARVSLRINPDVDARTHDKISTGRKQDKFGIAIDRTLPAYARAAELPNLAPSGLAMHIGSQLLSLAPYRAAFGRLAEQVRALRAAGHAVHCLDLGGGVGITYRDEAPPGFEDYAAVVREMVGGLGCDLMFEPGRSMVGNAGVLVARVLYMKDGGVRPVAVVDAAMNDLARPAMYGAYHAIVPVTQPQNSPDCVETDVVGPICESGDTFAVARSLPPLAPGDLVAFGSAGAYGSVMSSAYNSRPPAPEVLVSGDRFAVVRARQTVDDLIRQEAVPDWLEPPEGA